MPICTIAIPVHNRTNRSLNHVALQTALAEKLSDLEILVVDDCSTDGTWELLQNYRDPRLRLLRNEQNLGLFGNFNRCLQLARGKYLRILCSDDRLLPDTVSKEIEIMERHSTVALLSTRGVRLRPDGTPIGLQADHLRPGVYDGRAAIAAILWWKACYGYNPLNYPSGVLLRRNAALEAGAFDTEMRVSGDVEFFLRMLLRGQLAIVPHTGCAITVHADQQGAQRGDEPAVMEEQYRIVERFRAVLQEAGLYDQVIENLAGISLGKAQKCWRHGQPAASRRHLEVARRRNSSTIGMCIALAQLVGRRALLRVTRVRMCPIRPLHAL